MANELFYDILPHVLQIRLINTMRSRSSAYISDCETERPSCYACTTTQASIKLAISFITLPLLAVNSGQRRSLPACMVWRVRTRPGPDAVVCHCWFALFTILHSAHVVT